MKYWRIFWTCDIVLGTEGYYWHYWKNFLFGMEAYIFAGYNKKALRDKKSTFNDIIP